LIDLSLSVESIEQGGADGLWIGWRVVEVFATFARDAGKRHTEIAGKVGAFAPCTVGPDPLDQLVKGVGR
jgi:hypothetical protein